jgi:hypothetical protein
MVCPYTVSKSKDFIPIGIEITLDILYCKIEKVILTHQNHLKYFCQTYVKIFRIASEDLSEEGELTRVLHSFGHQTWQTAESQSKSL